MSESHYYVYEDLKENQPTSLKVGRPVKPGGPTATRHQNLMLKNCIEVRERCALNPPKLVEPIH